MQKDEESIAANDGDESGADPRGLWVRVSATLADDKDVRKFARDLFTAPAEQIGAIPFWILLSAAEGLLVNLWGEVADHSPTGSLEGIDDEQIEEWARYRGEPGRFARLFRDRFVSDGIIKRWIEFNGKLLEYRQRERERWERRKEKVNSGRRKGRSGSAPADAPAVQSGADADPLRSAPAATVTVYGNNAAAAVSEAGPGEDPIRRGKSPSARSLELTIALNQAMQKLLGDAFEPALPYSGHALEAAEKIAEMGIEHDWARQAIYEIALKFKPTAENPSISSIAYFPQRLERHWQRRIARRLAAEAQAPQEGGSVLEAPSQSSNGSRASESARSGKNSEKRFGSDLKGEALLIFGRLRDSIERVNFDSDHKPLPDGCGPAAYAKDVVAPHLLAELSDASREALRAIGGERAILGQGNDWKFAAAYAASAQAGKSTEPRSEDL